MTIDEARVKLSFANKILAHEGVLDAFGHVSLRHPLDPQKFLLSRSLAPSMVRAEDILEFWLEFVARAELNASFYAERVIHGEIYASRPDVMAICHHHAPAMLTFCISDKKLVPISQMGAVMGHHVPVWDSQTDFGDTNLLFVKPEEGRSLARSLGPHWLVLMKRHGATCVGRNIEEMTFRTIHSVANAETQLKALAIGNVDALTHGEIEKAGEIKPLAVERAWQYWASRVRD